jgi:FkbH-like protein
VARLRDKGIRTLITTLPAPIERFFGNFAARVPSSFSSQIHRLNAHIRTLDGVLIVDAEHLASLAGLANWFDDRLWYHAKYPCHPRHLTTLAQEFTRIALAAQGKLIKALVLDLDNTLWGGIIGDDGVEGISIGGIGHGEAFRDFQRYLKVLQERGIILCVCSKNEESNARLPFMHHDGMVLKEEDIAVFYANWEPKSANIRRIAETLNIGLDSLLFVDDSAFERNEVRTALPQVTVPEMPEDPANYVRTLELGGWLETPTPPSAEDATRTASYRAEHDRRKLQENAGNVDDYLASLDMRASFRRVTGQHLQRAAQLIQRSNQFNPRTQRVTQEQLAAWVDDAAHPCFCTSVSDRFGDYGMISVICGEVTGDTMFLHELVMSCRVLARGVEQFINNQLATYAKAHGVARIVGEYLPTAKNGLVSELFPRLGFEPIDGEVNRWQLTLDSWQPLPTFVQAE